MQATPGRAGRPPLALRISDGDASDGAVSDSDYGLSAVQFSLVTSVAEALMPPRQTARAFKAPPPCVHAPLVFLDEAGWLGQGNMRRRTWALAAQKLSALDLGYLALVRGALLEILFVGVDGTPDSGYSYARMYTHGFDTFQIGWLFSRMALLLPPGIDAPAPSIGMVGRPERATMQRGCLDIKICGLVTATSQAEGENMMLQPSGAVIVSFIGHETSENAEYCYGATPVAKGWMDSSSIVTLIN